MSTHPLVESFLQSDDLAGWLVEQHQTAKSTERFRRETDRLFFEQWARMLADCPNEICQTKIETLRKIADPARAALDIVVPALVNQCLRGATEEIRAAAAEALGLFGYAVLPQRNAITVAAASARRKPEERTIVCGDAKFSVWVSDEGGDLHIELATSSMPLGAVRLKVGDAEPVLVQLRPSPKGTRLVGSYAVPGPQRSGIRGDTICLLPPLH